MFPADTPKPMRMERGDSSGSALSFFSSGETLGVVALCSQSAIGYDE